MLWYKNYIYLGLFFGTCHWRWIFGQGGKATRTMV